jgi:hypothetical protein
MTRVLDLRVSWSSFARRAGLVEKYYPRGGL